jgi:hypothetical protein
MILIHGRPGHREKLPLSRRSATDLQKRRRDEETLTIYQSAFETSILSDSGNLKYMHCREYHSFFFSMIGVSTVSLSFFIVHLRFCTGTVMMFKENRNTFQQVGVLDRSLTHYSSASAHE